MEKPEHPRRPARFSLEFLDMRFMAGPNVWTVEYHPVLEAVVDIGALEDFPSDLLPGLPQRLETWLPGLVEHRCSVGERGGFLQRLERGTWAGHILEHVSLELQSMSGFEGGFGRAREMSRRGVYKVAISVQHEAVGRHAMAAARELVLAAIHDEPFDVAAAVETLRDMADSLCLGPSTAHIVAAAKARRIPWMRLNSGNLVQIGHGAAQRRIWTAETDRTSAIAEGISRDKQLTRQLLSACGVAVSQGRRVDSLADAWDAAEELGLPVVVKPLDGNHGRGVFTHLTTRQEVEAAYVVAIDEGSGVLVERFIEGLEHRLLVVGGRLVAAARGDIARVIGDGRSTLLELIETQLNSDPRRGHGEDQPLNRVRLDSAAILEIRHQGYADGDAIPAEGAEVVIQRNGNVAIDCTAKVHPEVAAQACLAARIVGLDIAGIDIVSTDIGQPFAETGGAIVEVNAGPGLLMHIKPAEGPPQAVGAAIVGHLFPDGANGRIPLVGVSGSHGSALAAQLIARILSFHPWRTGLVCAMPTEAPGILSASRRDTVFEQGRKVLMNPAVEAAVIETPMRELLDEGTSYDICAVGVVTGLDTATTFPDRDMETPEQLHTILRTQVDVVPPWGVAVLNAEDEIVAGMAALCEGEVVYFSRHADHPVIAAHLSAEGRAVVICEGELQLRRGSRIEVLCQTDDLPGGCPDTPGCRAHLAAIAAAWALGVDREQIRAATLHPVPA
ncbi:MAG: cyanophycin synthetase [Burkholderiales bacterium]|nr:cyanophycin synthetase [Burkholderiales bacterium]